MRATPAAAALVVGALVVGCGTPSPDLFVVERSGTVPGAKLRLLVSDGAVRCNGGPERTLPSDLLLEAREIARELPEAPPQVPGGGRVFSFAVRFDSGRTRFPDTAARPPVLGRVARFTRTAAQDLCGLPR